MEGKKISFSFKKKADTRGFVKPEEKPSKVPGEEYITGIEDKRIESQGGGGGSTSSLVIPLTKGQKISDEEPTVDNYEEIPVEGFGLAMLRGMGWTENDEKIKPIETYIRPKGAGLGHKLSEK